MESINLLLDIAGYLELNNIEAELQAIKERSEQENAPIILPLVGEFSSGKTTLINALTDSWKFETATQPTTATIYEIHFGSDTCHATIVNEKDEGIEIAEITDLKNEILADAKVVIAYDSSKRVPATTILVDTPGLSSPDVKHKQTLVDFLPKADAILLVTDINQQVTRSLTNFIEMMKLSKRPIFLILTKSDTKPESDIESAKKYISDNCKIPLKQVAVVSSSTGRLDDLYRLFDEIQKDKKEILKQVDNQRLKHVEKTLGDHITDLMKASSSDKELDEAIRQEQYALEVIKKNIDRLITSVDDDITEYGRMVARRFEDTILSELMSLVSGSNKNFDKEAVSKINNISSLLMNDYKSRVRGLLQDKARSNKGTEHEVYLSSIDCVDVSSIEMSGLNYDLDLNNMGHEFDGVIKTGVIAVGAAAAVAAVAATGGATAIAGAGSGAKAITSTLSVADNAIDLIDTVSDVGSIISNQRSANRIEKAVRFVSHTKGKIDSISTADRNIGQQMGRDKGLIDTMVGFATDKLISKPKRTKAIRDYVDGTLAPEFKVRLSLISQQVVSDVRDCLSQGASEIIEQKTASLLRLKSEMNEKKACFAERMNKLREYQTKLLTL